MTEASHLTWRKSSYSNGSGGNCVEIAAGPGQVVAQTRDSKDPEGPTLAFPLASWRAFVGSVREGRLG
jgi:hypothetical protein